MVEDRAMPGDGQFASISLWENCGNGGYCSVVGDDAKVEAGCELGSRSDGVEVVGPSIDVPPPDSDEAIVEFIFKSWNWDVARDKWLLDRDLDWCETSTL